MAKPKKVRVSPDELSSLVEEVTSLFYEISNSYAEIDQSLEELKEFWVGDKRKEFYAAVAAAQSLQSRSSTIFDNFCEGALRDIPHSYGSLNASIEARAKALVAKG